MRRRSVLSLCFSFTSRHKLLEGWMESMSSRECALRSFSSTSLIFQTLKEEDIKADNFTNDNLHAKNRIDASKLLSMLRRLEDVNKQGKQTARLCIYSNNYVALEQRIVSPHHKNHNNLAINGVSDLDNKYINRNDEINSSVAVNECISNSANNNEKKEELSMQMSSNNVETKVSTAVCEGLGSCAWNQENQQSLCRKNDEVMQHSEITNQILKNDEQERESWCTLAHGVLQTHLNNDIIANAIMAGKHISEAVSEEKKESEELQQENNDNKNDNNSRYGTINDMHASVSEEIANKTGQEQACHDNTDVVFVQRDATVKEQVERIINERYANLTFSINCQKTVDSNNKITISLTVHLERKRNGNNLTVEEEWALSKFHGIAIGNTYYSCLHNALREAFKQIGIKYKSYRKEETDATPSESKTDVEYLHNTGTPKAATENESLQEWNDQVMEGLEITMKELVQEQELQLQSLANRSHLSSASENEELEKEEKGLLDVNIVDDTSKDKNDNNNSNGKGRTFISDKTVNFTDNNTHSNNKNYNNHHEDKYDENRLFANDCTLGVSLKTANSDNKVNDIMNSDLERSQSLDYFMAQSVDRKTNKRVKKIHNSLLQRYFDIILKRSAAQPSLSITTSLPSQTQITSLDRDKVDWLKRWRALRNEIVVIELRDGDELIAKSSGPYCSFLTVLMQTLHEAAKLLTDETLITLSMRSEMLRYAQINDLGDASLLWLMRKLLNQIYNIPSYNIKISYVNCQVYVWRCQISIRLPSPPDSFQYEASECGSWLILSCEEHTSKWKATNAAALAVLRQLFAEILEAQAATSSHLMKVITAVEEQNKVEEKSKVLFNSSTNVEEILQELMRRDGRSFKLSLLVKQKINRDQLRSVSHMWFATLHVTDVSGKMEKRPDIVITEEADKKSKCEKKVFALTILLLYKEYETEITELMLNRNHISSEELCVLKNKVIEREKANMLNRDSQTVISKEMESDEVDCCSIMSVSKSPNDISVSCSNNDLHSDGNKEVNNITNTDVHFITNLAKNGKEEKESIESTNNISFLPCDENEEHNYILANIGIEKQLLGSQSEISSTNVSNSEHGRITKDSIAVENSFAPEICVTSSNNDCKNSVDATIDKNKIINNYNEEHGTVEKDDLEINKDEQITTKSSSNKYSDEIIFIDNSNNNNNNNNNSCKSNKCKESNSDEFRVALTRFLTEMEQLDHTVILQCIKNCVREYVACRSASDHVTWKLEERVEQISKATSVMYKCSLWITSDDVKSIPTELSFSEHKFKLFAIFYAYNNLIVKLTNDKEEASSRLFDFAHSDAFRRLEAKRTELLKLFNMSGDDKSVTLKVVAVCVKIIFGLTLKVHWTNLNKFKDYYVQLVGEYGRESSNNNNSICSGNNDNVREHSEDESCQNKEAKPKNNNNSYDAANDAITECITKNENTISSVNSMMLANAEYISNTNKFDDEDDDDDNNKQYAKKEESSITTSNLQFEKMFDINLDTFVEMVNISGKENDELDLRKQYILGITNNCDFNIAVNLCVESVRKNLERFFHAGVYCSETLLEGDEVIDIDSKSVLGSLMRDTINEINNSEVGVHKRVYTPQLRLIWSRSKDEKAANLQNYTVIFEAVPSNGESAIVLERVDAPNLLSALYSMCERVSTELKKTNNHLFILSFRYSSKKESNRCRHLTELCKYNYGLTCTINTNLENNSNWVCKVKLHLSKRYAYIMAAISGHRRKYTTRTASIYILDSYFSFQNCEKGITGKSVLLANEHLTAQNQYNQIVGVNAKKNNCKVEESANLFATA